MFRRSAAAGIWAVTVLLCAASVASGADPTNGEGPAPTAAELAISDAKAQLAEDWLAVKQGKSTPAAFAKKHAAYAGVNLAAAETQAGVVTSSAAGGIIGMSQRSQSNAYYCGPATAYEILKYRLGQGPAGETLTQAHLAAFCKPGYLCTDALGETPWYVGSSYTDANGYPMTSTLNRWTDTNWYITVKGTTYSEAQYETNLIFDIDHLHPVAISVREQANAGYHLPGHPTNKVMGHWIAASGYDQSGDRTYYADSVYGVSTSLISWAGNVPQFSYYSSARMYSLFSSRGYVW